MAKGAQSAKKTNMLDEISNVAVVDLNEVMTPAEDASGRKNYRYGLSSRGDDIFVDCANSFRLVRAGEVIERKKTLTAVK